MYLVCVENSKAAVGNGGAINAKARQREMKKLSAASQRNAAK
jgi:hypothetical protein